MTFLAASLIGPVIVVMAGCYLHGTKDFYPDFCIAVWIPCAVVLLTVAGMLTVTWHPRTMDLLLYRADLAIGLDPLALGRFVYRRAWLHWTLVKSYQLLPVAFALAYAAEKSRTLLKACIVAPIFAFVIYNLIPAVGPLHAFGGFPWAVSDVAIQAAPRNCVPSMHFSWALLILWNAKRPWTKAAASVFVVLTGLATVGLGEHYFIDLIVAVPFCWTVQKAMSLAGGLHMVGLMARTKDSPIG
jgi:hypothetical protein